MGRRGIVIAAAGLALALGLGLAGCSQSGQQLYEGKCSPCHSLETVTGSTYAISGDWADEVDRMKDMTTTISDADAEAITAYLEETYPGK